MIGIKPDGVESFLETTPDTTISLKLENPMLGDGDKISPGSYSYPFNLPRSEFNAARLGHPDVVENSQPFAKISAGLFFAGVPFKKGTLKTTGIGSQFTSNFLFGLSQISPDFKTASLREVMDENLVIDASPITKKIFIKRVDAGTFDLFVNGTQFTGTALAFAAAVNSEAVASLDTDAWVPYCTVHASGTSPGGSLAATYLEFKLVKYTTIATVPTYTDATDPLLELHVYPADDYSEYAVESFDMNGYFSAFDTFFEGYFDETYPTDKFRMPVVLNGGKYKANDVLADEIVNFRDQLFVDFLYRNEPYWGNSPGGFKNHNSLQPFAMLKYVLDRIAQAFDFEYEGDFYTDPKTAEKLVWNTSALDVPQGFMGEHKFVWWRRSFNMNELVPDMKVVDFFSGLQTRFNLAIYFNEDTNKVRIQYREPIVKSYTYDDITPISSGKRDGNDSRITGVKLVSKLDDKEPTSVEDAYSYGVPEQEISMGCGHLNEMRFRAWFGPYIYTRQPFGETFKFKVICYRGMINGMPWAHKDGIGFDLYNTSQVFLNYWQYWFKSLKDKRSFKIKVAWPLRRLLAFDWSLIRRYDRTNYLVKSIDVKLTNSRVEISDTELLTV